MDYRLYFMNSNDHIEQGVDVEGADDAAAIRIAEGQADGRPMELWRGATRIKRFGADVEARAPRPDQHPARIGHSTPTEGRTARTGE